MRLDVDLDGQWAIKCVEVFVDGVKSEHCFMADEELGVVEEAVLDEYGSIKEDYSLPRKAVSAMRWGKVELRPRPGHEKAFTHLQHIKSGAPEVV